MIKAFISLIITIAFISSVSAQKLNEKVRWYSLKEALELQKTHPRKIMIDVYTDWCIWCKRMDTLTFSHPVIANILNTRFYPVKFNAESSDSVVFGGQKFGYQTSPGGDRGTNQFAIALFQATRQQMGYPATAYFDESLQLINLRPGYIETAPMELWLNYVMDEKYKPTPLEEYQRTFKSKIQASTSPAKPNIQPSMEVIK
jgi:thioredoxin-related protein